MFLFEVNNSKTEESFIKFPKELYKKDLNWICPLDAEIRNLFNPLKNTYLKNGEAIRWIIKDSEGNVCGRIAAFYNRRKAYINNIFPVGAIGFFECIDNKEIAFKLFDIAKEWLNKKGMEAMDGPVNIGENFVNWGLLVKGFIPPGYGMNYNKPYYQKFFEDYGFKLYFRQYSFHLDIKKPFPERFWKIAEWVESKHVFKYEHFSFNKTDKYINDLCQIYNKAWSGFKKDFTPLTVEDVKPSFLAAKHIIDEKMAWFAYHNDEPIAFFVMYPDVNQIIKYFNGKMNLINIVRFFYLKNTKKINRIRTLVAGVAPQFQNSGIESAILSKYKEAILEQKSHAHYKEVELSWVGDFNRKMQALYINTGAEWAKTHYTYRYLFDRNKEYIRFMPDDVHLLGGGRD